MYFLTDWDIAADGGKRTTYRIIACVRGGCDYIEDPVLDAEGDV
jgi:hypothetical protein